MNGKSRRKNACTFMHTHTPQVTHVCEPLTLIRAVEGLTPCGGPPLHSGDGHSQPVNSPRCKRLLTKSRRMWDSHKRDDGDTLTSNLRHAGTKRQAHTTLSCSCPPPSLQWDSSWPVRLSVTLMRLLSYGQFLHPSRVPPVSLFSVQVNSKSFT